MSIKKSLLKMTEAILAIVVFFIGQHYIRQYLGIEPRTWFIIVFFISCIGILFIAFTLNTELQNIKEYVKNGSFSENVKPDIEKMIDNKLCQILSLIIHLVSLAGVLYNVTCFEDFITRKIMYVVFLATMVLNMLYWLLRAIVKREERVSCLVEFGLWDFNFLVYATKFVLAVL